jgi:rSAM/selenodomain-associated transferase 1
MSMKKKALIVFVKAPVPGKVKTRLQPELEPEKIVEIYKSFITEIVFKCIRLKEADTFVGCAPAKNNEFLQRVTFTHKLPSFNQRGNNLGEKIVNAFRDHFKKGYRDIVLLGSDSPTIPTEYIRKAFAALEKNDLILGPCCDKGLYLIGARKSIVPAIFQNIAWDTNEVLGAVMKKLYSLDIRFSLLPFWYDVDTIEDLKFLEIHRQYLNRKRVKIKHKATRDRKSRVSRFRR